MFSLNELVALHETHTNDWMKMHRARGRQRWRLPLTLSASLVCGLPTIRESSRANKSVELSFTTQQRLTTPTSTPAATTARGCRQLLPLPLWQSGPVSRTQCTPTHSHEHTRTVERTQNNTKKHHPHPTHRFVLWSLRILRRTPPEHAHKKRTPHPSRTTRNRSLCVFFCIVNYCSVLLVHSTALWFMGYVFYTRYTIEKIIHTPIHTSDDNIRPQ